MRHVRTCDFTVVIEYKDDKEYSQRVWFSCLGEPNDSSNNEDCATVKTDGQWNDDPCIGSSFGSICEVGKYVNKSHLFYCTKYEKNRQILRTHFKHILKYAK